KGSSPSLAAGADTKRSRRRSPGSSTGSPQLDGLTSRRPLLERTGRRGHRLHCLGTVRSGRRGLRLRFGGGDESPERLGQLRDPLALVLVRLDENGSAVLVDDGLAVLVLARCRLRLDAEVLVELLDELDAGAAGVVQCLGDRGVVRRLRRLSSLEVGGDLLRTSPGVESVSGHCLFSSTVGCFS